MHKLSLVFAIFLTCAAGCSSGLNCPNNLPASCPTPMPSYSTDVQPIFQKVCLTCHGPGGAEYPQRDFTTYEKIHDQYSVILDQVNACLMPPNNGPTLSEADRLTLLGWLVCKAPNN